MKKRLDFDMDINPTTAKLMDKKDAYNQELKELSVENNRIYNRTGKYDKDILRKCDALAFEIQTIAIELAKKEGIKINL